MDNFAAVSEALSQNEMAQEEKEIEKTSVYTSTTGNYADLFPSLPATSTVTRPMGAWGSGPAGATAMPTFKSSTVSEVLRVASSDVQATGFGESVALKMKKIQEQTGCKIEMSQNKLHGYSFVISGKAAAVHKAKNKLQAEFQVQKTIELQLPVEHFSMLRGKDGAKVIALQEKHGVRIEFPRRDASSNKVRVTGSKEGVESAALELKAASEERARQGRELINIDNHYHLLVFGPNNCEVDAIVATAGASVKIYVPSNSDSNVLVYGNKEEVDAAVSIIKQRYTTIKASTRSLKMIIPKHQHKWLRPRKVLDAIYTEVGVVVNVPAEEENTDEIVLLGEGSKLGKALEVVISKANSMMIETVICPTWLHKYIIGSRRSVDQSLREGLSSELEITFTPKNTIEIQGPTEDVIAIKARLSPIIAELARTKAMATLRVNPDYHKHIIGKGGQNIKRIQEECAVEVSFPKENDPEDRLIIEGTPIGVAKAKTAIEDLVTKQTDTKTVEIVIPQKFHGLIISNKTDFSLSKVRETYPSLIIKFPSPTDSSDTVRITGLGKEVDSVVAQLEPVVADLIEKNFTLKVIVFRQYHSQVIGKGGANINKIRTSTNTKVIIPEEKLETDIITVVGKKDDCLKAQKMLLAIQAELVKISEVEVKVEPHLHSSLIGPKGAVVRSIQQDCNNVAILFPHEGDAKSDIITIRGPAEDVAKAKKMLQKLAAEKALVGHVETIPASLEMLGFLIGKDGVNKKLIQEKTDTRIVFPARNDEEKNILVIGRKQDALKARLMLEELIAEFATRVVETITVPAEHANIFYRNNNNLAKYLMEELGVSTMMGRERMITLRGKKDDVTTAIAHIEKLLEAAANEVTVDVSIDPSHYGSVIGKGGNRLQAIRNKYKVFIRFPQARGSDISSASEDSIVHISGLPDDVESAKAELLALVPVQVAIEIPKELHGGLIGRGGRNAGYLRDKFGVTMRFPSRNSDEVVLTGPQDKLEEAKNYINDRLTDLNEERKERELRSFTLTVEVDASMVSRVIGKGGQTINSIRNNTGCQIDIPKAQDRSGDDASGTVTITLTGYQASCEAAKDIIESLMTQSGQSNDFVEDTIEVDHRVHGHLIGSGGKMVMRLSKQLGVQIVFPSSEIGNSDIVSIRGPRHLIEPAKDRILDLAEEYLLDLEEDGSDDLGEYSAPQRWADAVDEDSARKAADLPSAFHVDFPAMPQDTCGSPSGWASSPTM